ncbi:hypothetical protein D9757_002853 [Collybiopsis confluens]|uniref:Altered inheritance of mitochondria protein 6 n=1 Tax=Collybiopsis confluens TaxID=2823264 RepID=A0A8H5HVN8_9AGAR|nr:hypothetical protein D9757_002853 [Collybiopsis confluens]
MSDDYSINQVLSTMGTILFHCAQIYPLSLLISTMVPAILISVIYILVAQGIGCLGKPGVLDQIAMLEDSNSSLLQYPTQFTQNIVPKQIHSHNDYWRDVPLLTALSFGVASVEADVWFVNDTLFVGHELAALTPDRTFDSLYVQPLLAILARQNPVNSFTANQTSPNGVFDTSSGTPLQVLIDMKTDGNSTLPPVLKALEPLRQLKYLTTFENGILTLSAVTAIGTGNTPLDGIKALSPRDVFFDAPLIALDDPNTVYNVSLSPIASTDYGPAIGWPGIGAISDSQLANMTKFIHDAHSRGIKARFWDTPGWPIQARHAIWEQLLNTGADWLNADDLEAASDF